MKQRVWENPWRLMLAINVAVALGVFAHKIRLTPYIPYIHLLVDYHFCFIKRALIGAMVALFTDKVPVWLPYALGGTVWLLTLALFMQLFRRTFGFDERQLPLLVFTAGSPFFFKNFMHTLGHFDIYGCFFAICLLLLPARSFLFVLLATSSSIILLLIHHIHALMYVPTIVVIVMLRYYLVTGVSRQNCAAGLAALLLIGALFVVVQFWGTMPLPHAEFVAYLWSRMADPSRTNLLAAHALEPARRSRLRAADLVAHAALAIFCRDDPRAARRLASSNCDRGPDRGQPRLSRDVRDRVRLFQVGVELGRLHGADPARDQDAAGRARGRADPDGWKHQVFRACRDADPARWDCATVLGSRISTV
jgi:hypothetical protein